MEEKKEFEIDLVDLFYYLKKHIALILVVTLLFGIVGFVGTKLFGTPQYRADVTMLVANYDRDRGLAYADIQMATFITQDASALIKRRSVTSEVIRELGLSMSDAQLAGKIAISSQENTRVITVSVTDTDPRRAADIANSVGKYATKVVEEKLSIKALQIIDSAQVPSAPVGPSASRNAVLAAGAALVFMVAVFCLIRVLDNTIRTEEDVERYLGLSTLGVIPISEELEKTRKKKLNPLQRLLKQVQPKQAKKK